VELGEDVSLVVLFDAVNPDYYRETRSLVHSAGRTMTSLRSIIKLAASGGFMARLSGLRKALGTLAHRLIRRIADIYTTDYRSAPVSFPVLVVRPPASSSLEKPDLGWSRACGDSLTVVEVPGDHSSIFREPNVQVLGWKLRQQLDTALSRMRPVKG
jgi:thioesterase domain-containing protein